MADEPQWVQQQKKAFGMWVNTRLAEKDANLEEGVDLGAAFEHGNILVTLAEVLCGEKSGLKPVKNPRMRVQFIENCSIALKLLETHGFDSDCSAEMLVDCNTKMVLGFIYQLFVKFVGGEDHSHDNLLEWVNERTEPRGKAVHNWTTDFQDGTAFVGLVDSFNKAWMDADAVDKSKAEENMAEAFAVIERELGVAQLLDANDMVSFEPDDKSVKMYITLIQDAWNEKAGDIEAAAAAAAAEAAAAEAAAAAAAKAAEEEAARRAAMSVEEVWAERDEFADKVANSVSQPLIGDTVPDFTQDSSEGEVSFYDWAGDSWVILFSHPADYTPVCTTELGTVAKLADEWAARNIKPLAVSVDTAESHRGWIKDINETQDTEVNFPILADTDRKVAQLYGMCHPNAPDTMAGKLTVRTVFIIDPNKVLKLSLTYPASTGRNFDEIIRVIDSLQLTAYKKCATPANWNQGDDVVIVPSVSNEEAETLFPGYRTVTPYLRMAAQPE